ncbi:MAG TPA: gliding motility protein GldN [Saprospiraceae bacterium]|nr:gliding motility protein GldN [Saprospiraceae bacterium]HRG65535.1 gliding motility protein GldN [Saprospiraceae bacterium]
MNNKFKLFVALLACWVCAFAASAQNAERVITESSAPAEDIYIDDIVSKRLITDAKLMSYEPIREADIAWEKRVWRLVETREKMNLAWRAEEAPFFNILKDMIQNGDITVFEDEKFKEALTFEDVEKKLFDVDTITTFDYDTDEEKVQVVKNTKDWRNIYRFRVKEIWFFDEEASMMKNRIIGIAPLYEETVEGLDKPLEYPLFWVYYPEARTFLSKHRVISDNNDVAPMTWADLLDNRYFTSIIYKKSNVLDFKVDQYFDDKDPMFYFDKLMESEKIKNELFNFEHDLWEY